LFGLVIPLKEAITKERLILYLIVALAGGGGSAMQGLINPPRPDPFTGAQGRSLHRSVDSLRDKVVELQAHDKLLMNWFYKEIEAGRYNPDPFKVQKHDHK